MQVSYRRSPATKITHASVIQSLASNKDHTLKCHTDPHQQQRSHMQVSYRHSPATKITHSSVIQTCTSNKDHTHECHTDTHQQQSSHTRVSYRCSPVTKITHASVIQTRTSNKNHTNMHARHTDAHQPHKSHTCTGKTDTHQPGSSLTHTHTRPHFSCLVPFPLELPRMGQPGQGEPRHRPMKTPFSTSGAGLKLKKQSEDTSRNTVETHILCYFKVREKSNGRFERLAVVRQLKTPQILSVTGNLPSSGSGLQDPQGKARGNVHP